MASTLVIMTPLYFMAVTVSFAANGPTRHCPQITLLQTAQIAEHSRNERSTPRDSILPSSPAIIPSKTDPGITEKRGESIPRAKAILSRLGYDVGRLDNRMTARFRAAIFQYQENHKLHASGKLNDATFNKLMGVIP